MTLKTYIVKLTPAELTDGGWRCNPLDPNSQKYPLAAETLASLDAQVRNLAHQSGRHVSCYIELGRLGVRKPSGFDALVRKLQFIRYVPENAQQAA